MPLKSIATTELYDTRRPGTSLSSGAEDRRRSGTQHLDGPAPRGNISFRVTSRPQRSGRTGAGHGDFCSGLLQHRQISAGVQVRNVVAPYRIKSLPRSPEKPPDFPAKAPLY